MKKIQSVRIAVCAAACMMSVHAVMAQQHDAYIEAVDEYCPAPGQFVNLLPAATADDTPETMAAKCTERLADDARQMITLGAWGGYVVFHFDHPVANVAGQRDFAVWGNAFANNAEPAIVMVSQDTNGNGLPDDQWYELAGSEYGNAQTIHDYQLTYTYAELQDVAWKDNQGQTGAVPRNSFHAQEYFPLWLTSEQTLTFSGARLPDNATLSGSTYLLPAYQYGYADNQPNADAEDCGFDIGWAVDANGQPVHLTHIDHVKCYNAMNQVCGAIGETSTEITGAEDLHLDASLAQAAGIDNVNANHNLNFNDNLNYEVYNLRGQRVSQPTKGLYIKNGRKITCK